MSIVPAGNSRLASPGLAGLKIVYSADWRSVNRVCGQLEGLSCTRRGGLNDSINLS